MIPGNSREFFVHSIAHAADAYEVRIIERLRCSASLLSWAWACSTLSSCSPLQKPPVLYYSITEGLRPLAFYRLYFTGSAERKGDCSDSLFRILLIMKLFFAPVL